MEARRWSRDYRTRLIREDVAGLERVQDLGHLELLMLRLPDLVGSPLSINAVREDLQVAHKTVANWLDILERLYAIFRLSPFGAPRIRAVKKEQKHYHWDWTLVPDPACASRTSSRRTCSSGCISSRTPKDVDLELRYFRDTDRREVDFVVVERPDAGADGRVQAGRCGAVDRGLCATSRRRFPDVRGVADLTRQGTKDYQTAEGIRVAPAMTLLPRLV